MNVVSRIAIEGKAKQGQDGASIKMYMKVGSRCSVWAIAHMSISVQLSVPVDSVAPGSTVALFPGKSSYLEPSYICSRSLLQRKISKY
jgi:hypothetical protein